MPLHWSQSLHWPSPSRLPWPLRRPPFLFDCTKWTWVLFGSFSSVFPSLSWPYCLYSVLLPNEELFTWSLSFLVCSFFNETPLVFFILSSSNSFFNPFSISGDESSCFWYPVLLNDVYLVYPPSLGCFLRFDLWARPFCAKSMSSFDSEIYKLL